MDEVKISQLKKEIARLKSQWPAHSVPAAMLERLDELEEALENELRSAAGDEEATKQHQQSISGED